MGYRRRRIWLLPLLLIIVGLCLHNMGQPKAEQQVSPAEERYIRVQLPDEGIQLWPLEEFLIGVVAAEMPASFEEEALKAQAIAARTYILSHSAPTGSPRHQNADICCDSTHCQAFLSIQQLEKSWGDNFSQNYQAISRAVQETAGLAIFYQGSLVETPYCSTCGGRTQAARDVWGKDIPYLQSVACNWDAHSPRALATVELSLEEAARLLAVKTAALTAMEASYSTGGAISSLQVGDKNLSGLQLRQALRLDSASCQWLIQNQRILFTTRGFGHGVGLCQYGADGMAKAGYKSTEIITHYYQGVNIALAVE